jgi:hypothetical protein
MANSSLDIRQSPFVGGGWSRLPFPPEFFSGPAAATIELSVETGLADEINGRGAQKSRGGKGHGGQIRHAGAVNRPEQEERARRVQQHAGE